jgi:DNA polymerase
MSIDYGDLVAARKMCCACTELKLTNASDPKLKVYDTHGHIGPWTGWYGDMNAELMVIGQDWGGVKYYLKHKGREEDSNPTNINLRILLMSIGIRVNLPNQPPASAKLFLTNAVLCHKPGGLTGHVAARSFGECAKRFLQAQVKLVCPKVVVPLGYQAYRALCFAYGLWPEETITEAVESPSQEILPTGSVVVPVFHCGFLALKHRPLEQQKLDWQRVKTALDSHPFPANAD